MTARWMLPAPLSADEERALAALTAALRVPPTVAELLLRRGVVSATDDPAQAAAVAAEFLDPMLKRLGDPFRLPQMREAVERTLAALDRRERIVLYGDYDVDGVTSLTLLTRLLRAYGADPQPFLPSRLDEGYGLSPEGVARCVESLSPQLLIAMDCGTTSVAEIAGLRARGVEVIVIDHHECPPELPACAALVNPKVAANGGAEGLEKDANLCTAGLAFKFCHALLKARPLPGFDLRELLDIAALGTVADIVPLVGENRILVHKGLQTVAQSRWAGVRELMEVAGVKPPVSPGDVGFKLGPRLNAAGRLGVAQAALELLLTDDPARARRIAEELNLQNRDRQEIEKTTLAEAEAQLAASGFDPATHAAIVVGAEGWHPGVLGIVASRLSRQHHRPAFVVGFDAEGLGKGSGRSIAGYPLVEALRACAEHLERFGGHEMAAGLTIRREHFDAFAKALAAHARATLTDDDLVPRIRLDGEMHLSEITLDFLADYARLQPFGMGNPQPLILLRGVRPAAEPVVLKEKHLRLSLCQPGIQGGGPSAAQETAEAMFFNTLPEALPRPPWDIAVHLERNEWRGRARVQLLIQHIRTAV